MIVKETMYAIQCDNCKKFAGDEERPYWDNEGYAEQVSQEENWHTEGHYHYCPDCYYWEDNDELQINTSRFKP